MPTEQQITIAAKLYVVRDQVRRLLGSRYHAKMAEIGDILTRAARARDMDVLSVANHVTQHMNRTHGVDAGPEILLILAAAVELIEPTPPLAQELPR